jgi:hypothetical protein
LRRVNIERDHLRISKFGQKAPDKPAARES